MLNLCTLNLLSFNFKSACKVSLTFLNSQGVKQEFMNVSIKDNQSLPVTQLIIN